MDVPAALLALEGRGDWRVLVGLGLHRPMSAAERAPLARWPVQEHDPDEVLSTVDVDGVPGYVNWAVARADTVLALGVVEPHQYAGFSGGHKAVAVGCGGRATIAALHHRDRVLAPGVRLGQLGGNPFRAAVDALGEAAGCAAALLWVPAAGLWAFGEPRAALAEAAALSSPWVRVERPAPAALLRVPPAKAGSLYQASRAATYLGLSPSPPVAPGGLLVLEAACPEGPGAEAGFVAALRGCAPPWRALLTGPPPTGPGAQRAVMLALLARDYRLRVVGCQGASALRALGIDAVEAPAEPEPDWLVVDQPFTRIPQLR